ncbi:cytochrome c maturation protein CcmE, partial [Phenylobacterium sp.]|uniref:cytochrome c maturation protein CcmE n=1 Tax=Phenylobacterium sp. TaxID=1871053 RepID=UPI0037CCBE33
MSGLLPRSPRARRRLTILAVVAPVLVLAVGLTLWGLRGSISYFYTPAQADAAKPPPGRSVQLGGLVVDGSVVKHADGRIEFTVRDNRATDRVHYQGDLPDLFREGQGIVATGT